jgi:hypothetical protein
MSRLACALALVLVTSPAFAQLEDVGSITFPTSTQSAQAQQHFLRGVAILHSFGWKQAIAQFQRAQKLAARTSRWRTGARRSATTIRSWASRTQDAARGARAVGAIPRSAARQGADRAREGVARGRRRSVG